GLGREPSLRRQARELKVPILVNKADTFAQVERALDRLLTRRQEPASVEPRPDPGSLDDALAALEECRLAVEQVVVPHGRPVELLPRTKRVRQMQEDLISRYQLRSDEFGSDDTCRLRVFPP
ncbi:MAG: AAA family ATPase, partial [Synechococcus sp.]